MKIAAVSEDGVTISQHFGRAPYYVVLTIEDGKILTRETRDKLGHAQFAGEPRQEAHGEDPRGHGFDPAAQDRHARMTAAIRDCQIPLARGTLAPALRSGASPGVGAGAYYSMEQAGIRPVITDIANIDEAALQAAQGTIVDHQEKLH